MTTLPPFPTVIPHKKRLPPIPEAHRWAIEEFLDHVCDPLERRLNDLRAKQMTKYGSIDPQTIQYLRHQVSSIRWLAALNRQRRGKQKAEAGE
jgi:hypothetical protein